MPEARKPAKRQPHKPNKCSLQNDNIIVVLRFLVRMSYLLRRFLCTIRHNAAGFGMNRIFPLVATIVCCGGPDSSQRLEPTTLVVSEPPIISNDPNPAFVFHTDVVHSFFVCRLNDGIFRECESPHTVAAQEGDNVFEVFAVNAQNGAQGATVRHEWVQDTTAPRPVLRTAPVTSPTKQATFTFESTEPVAYECSLDEAPFASCESPITYEKLGRGEHEFRLRGADAAGNFTPLIAHRWAVCDPVTIEYLIPAATTATHAESANGARRFLALHRTLLVSWNLAPELDTTAWFGFDLEKVPDTAIVKKVRLRVFLLSAENESQTVIRHSATNRWPETTAIIPGEAVSGSVSMFGKNRWVLLPVSARDDIWPSDLADDWITLGINGSDESLGTVRFAALGFSIETTPTLHLVVEECEDQ